VLQQKLCARGRPDLCLELVCSKIAACGTRAGAMKKCAAGVGAAVVLSEYVRGGKSKNFDGDSKGKNAHKVDNYEVNLSLTKHGEFSIEEPVPDAVLTELEDGEAIEGSDSDAMFKNLDTNNDGVLSLAEFSRGANIPPKGKNVHVPGPIKNVVIHKKEKVHLDYAQVCPGTKIQREIGKSQCCCSSMPVEGCDLHRGGVQENAGHHGLICCYATNHKSCCKGEYTVQEYIRYTAKIGHRKGNNSYVRISQYDTSCKPQRSTNSKLKMWNCEGSKFECPMEQLGTKTDENKGSKGGGYSKGDNRYVVSPVYAANSPVGAAKRTEIKSRAIVEAELKQFIKKTTEACPSKSGGK